MAKKKKWTALEPCGECGPVNTWILDSDLHDVTGSVSIQAPNLANPGTHVASCAISATTIQDCHSSVNAVIDSM